MPAGLEQRLSPYRDVFRTLWENRDRPGYAWRILRDGVCDGCALGTSGLRDWTMDGIHLCWIRLNLLRVNTMPSFSPALLENVRALRSKSEPELRRMGRIPVPFLRYKGQAGFQPISWDQAISLIAERIRNMDPWRLAFYLVSRGTVNETYYVAQKVARFLGTNHIDNSARVCHAPSTTALKKAIGFAASTCSYRDMIGSDLVVFFGSNVANNQPVVMKYLHLAKKQGTSVAVVNTFREPGMEKYWVPSSLDSALRGTTVADQFFRIRPGGDIAFINGVLKHLIEQDWLDTVFIQHHTSGWKELEASLKAQSFRELEAQSGTTARDMYRFARHYARARTAIFVWSMGITMHRYGVQNVLAIVNLALARGMVGRPHCGLMAIRGHSGVQGGAEVGAVPNQFPGGLPVNRENAQHFEQLWGFPVPSQPGLFAAQMIDAAHEGSLQGLYCVGSNLFGILPDSEYVKASLERIPLRIHQDVVLNPQMFLDPADLVLLLPATTRYEMAGGNTETTTERRIIFNPEIPGPRVPQARDEWRVLQDIARQVKPEQAHLLNFQTTAQIREEIARAVPFYQGIQYLSRKGDQVQWGGERLCEGGSFATADGKAHFFVLSPPRDALEPNRFRLTTRRGRQFNSMAFSQKDPLVRADRKTVIFSREDFQRLNLVPGQPVKLRSEAGEFVGRAASGPLHPGVVMMYWPEANVLIPRGVCDPECGIPAYRDAQVEVIPLAREA